MIVLDYTDRRPIYEQIIAKFKEQIVAGVIKPDEQMPSVRQLAVELSINPNTIQRAYTEMEKEGIIYCIKGRGNFVSQTNMLQEKKKKELVEEIFKNLDELSALGVSEAEVLHMIEGRKL